MKYYLAIKGANLSHLAEVIRPVIESKKAYREYKYCSANAYMKSLETGTGELICKAGE